MKKIFTSILVIMTLTSSAQSIRLFYNGQPLNRMDTVDVKVVTTDFNHVRIGYANISDDDIYFNISQERMQMADDASISFCAGGNCYANDISGSIFLMQDDTVSEEEEESFHCTYFCPSGGSSVVKYSFANDEDANDMVSVVIRFAVNAGVDDYLAEDFELCARPNPAAVRVNIACNVNAVPDAMLVIKNLAGMEVYRVRPAEGGKTCINVSDFSAGIYLYGIEANGVMLCTKKLLVK